MTTAEFFDFGASASTHSIFESGSAFTSLAPSIGMPLSAVAHESARRRVESLRAAEREQWSEVERLTPADNVLNRVAQRFTPPSEWFDEEDVI